MKNTIKMTLSVLLCAVILYCETIGNLNFAKMFTIKASAKTITDYKVGDTFEFGWYPQSQITDEDLICTLSGMELNWLSFNYTYGNGEPGSEEISDYMVYTDVNYKGNKYRGIYYSQYRPDHTFEDSSKHYQSKQPNVIYWYKYEPIDWIVIDANNGIAISKKVLDSQEWSNTIGNEQNIVPEYSKSSINNWLETFFCCTSFSKSQFNNILDVSLPTTSQTSKISIDTYTDYYLSQGGWPGEAWFWINNIQYGTDCVRVLSSTYSLAGFSKTNVGVRPIINLNLNFNISQCDVQNVGFNSGNRITNYKAGDIITFGFYPQSKVTYSSTVSALNGRATDWQSYGYMSGAGTSWSDGSAQKSDYMKYCDVSYNGKWYRGVKFDTYRSYYTNYKSTTSTSYTYQADNGYYINNTYWFEYEPLHWRVLDPRTGLVLCEEIIDSQPYSDTLYYYGSEYYKDKYHNIYANNYYESSIRAWLNDDFYNTAFTGEEKAQINKNILRENKCYSSSYPQYDSTSSKDAITLLTYQDMTNTSYGFSSSRSSYDVNRRAHSTDYAKCQGCYTYTGSSYKTANGEDTSHWWLRSVDSYSVDACHVSYDGNASSHYCGVGRSSVGVRPAFNFNLSSVISSSEEISVEKTEIIKFGINSDSFGQNITGCSGEKTDVSIEYYSEKYHVTDLTFSFSNNSISEIKNLFDYDALYKDSAQGYHHGFAELFFKNTGSTTLTITDPDNNSYSTTITVNPFSVTDKSKFRNVAENGDVSIDFTYSDLYFKDNKAFNYDLSKLSLRLALSAFTSYDGEDANGSYLLGGSKNVRDMLGKCKFFDIEVNDDYNSKREEDTIGVCIGRKYVGDGLLLAVAIRGGGYESEWSGNFKAATDGDTHPGFERAATKTETFISKYVSDHRQELDEYIKNGKLKFWVVGYSRAGATANLVSAWLGNQTFTNKNNIFGYTFEAPQPTKLAKNNNNYDYIFNIVNPIDVVPKVVMSDFGYARYGHDVILPSALDSNYSEIKDKIKSEFYNDLHVDWDVIFPELTTQAAMSDALCSALADYLESTSSDKMLVLSYLLQQLMCSKYSQEPTCNVSAELSYDEVIEFFGLQLAYYLSSSNYKVSTKSLSSFISSLAIKCTAKVATSLSKDPNLLVGFSDILGKLITDYINSFNQENNNDKFSIKSLSDAKNYLIKYCKTIKIPHYPEFTMATLDNAGERLSIDGNVTYRYLKVNCPVNVIVYDCSGKEVAKIIDNFAYTPNGSSIGCYIDSDGQKIFCLPSDAEYTYKIIANEDCNVCCQISEYNAVTSEFLSVDNYNSIKMVENQTLIGSLNNIAVNDENYSLKYQNTGAEIKPEKLESDKIIKYNVTVQIIGDGIATGGSYKVSGEFIELTAEPTDGQSFIGWFVNGTEVSTNKTYRFQVNNDVVVIAKFTEEAKKINSVSVDNISLDYKAKGNLNPVIESDNGVKYKVEYKSSNTNIVTVDNDGNVYAAKKGNATITCTVTDEFGNTVSDTCNVTVGYTWWQWIIIIVLFGWIWY